MTENDISIQSIKPAGKKKNIFIISLSSEEKFEVDDVAISNFHLFSGKKVNQNELKEIQSFAEIQRLKNYCFFILSNKMYTSKEIKIKLQKKSKNQDHREFVINELIRLKLINDDEYARLYLRSMVKKNKYSMREIRQKFFQKGLPEKFLSDNEIIDDDYELAVAKDLIQKKSKTLSLTEISPSDKQKLYAFLYRKGFNPDVISRVINNIEEIY